MPDPLQDHDLLVIIDTKLERALADIKDLKDGTSSNITNLQNDKADKADINRLWKRVTNLERIAYMGLGLLYAVEIYYRLRP